MPRKATIDEPTQVDVVSEKSENQPTKYANNYLEPPNPDRDEFADPQYIDLHARLPRIQAVRGTTPKTCGYFVPVSQMVKAGWGGLDESQLINYTFEASGEEEQGILIQNPRMLVCAKTPCLAYDRTLSTETDELVLAGPYTKSHKEDDNFGNIQYFVVFLLDQNNQPLHKIPLSYKAKGANQGSFSAHWQQFKDELTACHALCNGIPAKPKNSLFTSLGVFCFSTAREQVGTKQKSFACRVVDHEKPSLENWKNYFVGFSQLKSWVWEALEPQEPLVIPMLNPADEEAELPGLGPANS